MATADTARLIAALELQDKFSKPLQGAERQLGSFDKKLSGMQRSAQLAGSGVSKAFSTVAKVGVGAAVAGVGLLAVNVKAGVDALNELESVQTATNTVLASTKGISGQTAEGVRALAEEYESLNATMDDKVIQSGANMLLTFTNIRTKAFEPALEAALNMNEAMGGGAEGLQSTIIQVGKALNDPVKGVTALRRVGVQLSKQQEDQIKTLVEQNDLYGAQSIILDELTTQFGGRFAAAGKTAEGRQAALADRIEDVQKALAGPLIPAIDRVRERLITFLASDRVLQGAEQLGSAIAGLFTDANLDRGVALIEQGMDALTSADFSGLTGNLGTVASAVGGLPWQSIGDAARLLGTGSKALLDAFTALPPWVQTAVLTGWGLNKLTGGALGGIVGELGKGLIKGVLNMNAGVVHIKAGAVTGGGPGVPGGGGGKGGGFLGGLGTTLGVGAILAGITAVGTDIHRTLEPISHRFNELASNRGATRVQIEGDLERIAQETGRSVESLKQSAIPLLQSGNQKWSTISGHLAGLGPRIDNVARTPHNVNANINLNTAVNVGVSVLQQQFYRTEYVRDLSRISTNTAGI